MRKFILGTALLIATAVTAHAEEAQGDWGGVLMGRLRVIVHIDRAADGQYSATLKSPDQGTQTILADSVTATPDHLTFTVKKLNVQFDARWDEQKKLWAGVFTQGMPMPLELKRLDASGLAPIVFKRPQEEAIDKSVRPYKDVEVSFPNTKANITLAGTFSVPEGKGPFATVVLVAGSGPHKRDEEVLGHKIFLVLADHLNRQGIAVLRYDKRGVGKSTGNYSTATTLDFASDTEAAIAYLRTRTEVDQHHLGILGHSEGGLIAPLVASHDRSVAFAILLAAPGIRGDKLLIEQFALIGKANGESDEKIAKARSLNQSFFAVINSTSNNDEVKEKTKAIIDEAISEKIISADVAEQSLKTFTGPWFRQVLAYDPIPALKNIHQPILVLNGELDLQVPAKLNLDAIRTALSHNKHSTILALPKFNHLFQTAKTGSPMEYGEIEESFSPAVLKIISEWIVATTNNTNGKH